MIERSITELGAALRRGEVMAAAPAERVIKRHRNRYYGAPPHPLAR